MREFKKCRAGWGDLLGLEGREEAPVPWSFVLESDSLRRPQCLLSTGDSHRKPAGCESAAGCGRGRSGSGLAADAASAPRPLGPRPRRRTHGVWPCGRAVSQKNEGTACQCRPGNEAALEETRSGNTWCGKSEAPTWLLTGPCGCRAPLGLLSGMGLPSLHGFPRWPGWSWGRPSRPLTSSRDRDWLLSTSRCTRSVWGLLARGPEQPPGTDSPIRVHGFADPHGRKCL